MLKIRRDDEVIVIAGKDKGARGKVLKVQADGRLLIAGVNMVKKHKRGNPQAGEPGGIIEQEAPIQRSNVAIWNAATGKADRVGFVIEDKVKYRVFKSTGEKIGA